MYLAVHPSPSSSTRQTNSCRHPYDGATCATARRPTPPDVHATIRKRSVLRRTCDLLHVIVVANDVIVPNTTWRRRAATRTATRTGAFYGLPGTPRTPRSCRDIAGDHGKVRFFSHLPLPWGNSGGSRANDAAVDHRMTIVTWGARRPTRRTRHTAKFGRCLPLARHRALQLIPLG